MSSFITFSTAVSTRSKESVNAAELAEAMGCSQHHVAKVMQLMTKQGFIISKRGLHGGFQLLKDPKSISLLDIYEAIEGRVDKSTCIAPSQVCPFDSCLLCGIKGQMNNDMADILRSRTIDILMKADFDPQNPFKD